MINIVFVKMENKRPFTSYKFSKIPLKTIEQPIPMDLSAEITKMFAVDRIRKQRISEYMCDKIRQTKLKARKRVSTADHQTLSTRPATSKDLQKFSEMCPISEMSRFQEKAIRNKIQAGELEKKYSQLLSDIMKETKQEFVKIMHYAGLNLKIKSCHPEVAFTIEPYKFLGKTHRYQEFLQIRKQFRNKWILHYPIVRKIHKECVTNLPYKLFVLKFNKIKNLAELQLSFKDKTQRASQLIYEFYLKILSIVEGEEAKRKRHPHGHNHLKACTGLVSLHISKLIAHTLLEIVNVTALENTKPYISLKVYFENGLVLEPNAEAVIETYYNFLDKLIETGTEIYVLERNKVGGNDNKYMRLCLTEEFIKECKEGIRRNITKHYEPISSYLEGLNKKFDKIYKDINSEDFFESISDIVFEEGCKKINYYRDYLHKVMFIPDHEFFKIGKMSLTNYREILHDGLNDNINNIFQKLCAQHFWEVNDLCETFRMIQSRAIQKPLTTEELIETGKYMTLIKNEHLALLNQRVQNSLLSLCQIIDLGLLTEEHMELNSAAIKWVDDILPTIDEHSSTFETLKFDAEERLQKVVEDVNEMIKDIYPILVVLDEMDDIGRVNSYLNSITLHMTKIKEIEVQINWINKEEVSLSFPKSTYSEYEDLKNYIYPFYHLLRLCLEVQRNVSVWQDGPFEMLNYESTSLAVEKFHKELTNLHKTYRKKLRQAQDDNVSLRFKGTVDDPDILNWPAPLKLCGTALKLIEDFKPSVKVMKIICNPSLGKRHWMTMSEIAGSNVTPNAGTTLRKIMRIDFQSKLSDFEIISTGATKEKQLKDDLDQLKTQWENIKFSVTAHKEVDTNILTDLEEIEAIVNDHTIKILNMRGSVFVKPHDREVRQFYGKIIRIKSTLEYWSCTQNQLLKLLPIFSYENLNHVLPDESEMFTKVFNIYRSFITLISKDSLVLKVVDTTDITDTIKKCLIDLEIVSRGTVKYLEVLRQNFPRLYFLTNDEMLRIISNKKLALEGENFLAKLFPGITQLNSKNGVIEGISNSESDVLKFEISIELVTEDFLVEKICAQIQEQMKCSLKKQMIDCYKAFKRVELKELLSLYCKQIIEVVSQIYWTQNIENALSLTHNIKLRMYYQKLTKALDDKVKTYNNGLTNTERLKLKSLIVNDIHNKNFLKRILDSNQIDKNNFEWEAYFKYYFTNHCFTHVMNNKIMYVYEYQDKYCSIVSAPLTDRCIRTLLNAFFLHFNGLLEGHDGSSLAETVKNLVRTFGGLLFSFNCTKNLNCSTLIQWICGSLLSGAFLCLNNFHLVKSGILSVISQELSLVQAAKKQNASRCVLGGKLISFSSTNFICACVEKDSYNTFLPANVNVLFRSVRILTPDLEKIAEITLYSLGFQSSSLVSRKICCVFKLLQSLMPEDKHYNFGIQTLKQVLLECEKMKIKDPREDETFIAFRSIGKIFASQVEKVDEEIFRRVVADLFPNISQRMKSENDVKKTAIQKCEKNNFHANEKFVYKLLEAYDSMNTKSCVIFVGETYTGKTTLLNLCKEIYEALNDQAVLCHFVNPNCLDYDSIYGYSEPSRDHWIDGILTRLLRSFARHENKINWLIFDGTIDSLWMENIKSLLDEDRKFFSDSGEVLLLANNCSIIFEIENLNASSPSILSRSSVIYLHQSTLGWYSLVQSWINSCKSEWIHEYHNQIFDLFCWIIPPCLEFIEKNCSQLCTTSPLNLVKNMILLTQMILDDVFRSAGKKEEDLKTLPTWIQATVIQAGMLGLGAILDNISRQKFDEFYKLLWKGQILDHPHPKSLEKLEVSIPHEGLIYDYQYIYKQRGNWKLYHDIVKSEKIVESPYLNRFLVPTVGTFRCNNLLDMFIKNNQNVLLIGSSSTGKTVLIEDVLMNRINKNKFEITHLNFNTNLASKTVQRFILSKLNKRKTGLFTPPSGQRFLLFIDNLNLVSTNTNGESGCLELLRQHLDHNVWYDFDQGHEIIVENMQLIAAMGLLEGARKKLCQRVLRHFTIFAIDDSTEETITRIYSNNLLHIWRKMGFPSDIVTIVNQITQATFNIYKQVKLYCRATLSRIHYCFNLNSFSNVIQGCSMLRKEIFDGNKKIHLKIWAHEIMRVFGDRLSLLDNIWLQGRIKEAIQLDFNESFEDNFESNGCPPSKIIFSALNDRDNSSQRYDEICDRKFLLEKLSDGLESYNNIHKVKLEIIFFQYALEKILKISRILSLSPGNAILIGSCGSGRRNLSKLACFLHKYKLFEPVITENFSVQDWKNEIKIVLKESGAMENQCVFLVTEEQLIEEVFLQNVDHLLQNGEVPDLYNMEERQEILELARLSAQGGNKNLEISSAAVFHHFNKRSKENLHLILCISANCDTLRSRMRNYPNLQNCHVIWWEDWPDESLQVIAQTWTSHLELPVKKEVVDTLIYFHRDSQSNTRQILRESKLTTNVTPVSFIHLVKLFVELITSKKNEMGAKKNLYLQGLAKLCYAAKQISDMQKVLGEYQPQLEEMTQQAVVMTEQIALETIEVEKASALVRKDEEIASEQAIVAQILKSECESELAQAIPILEDAISALNTLKPSDITLVKSMKNPPDAIKLVMAAVCVIKDVKPDRIPDPSTGRKTIDYWGPSKRILGDMNFLQSLKDFDKDHIKPEIMVKIRKEYLPHKDFKPHVVAKASSAAEGLCKWIIAMDMYDKVAKEVAPKKEKLEKAEREYGQTMAILNQKKDEVKRIEEKLASLKALLNDATKKQLKLQREVDACNKKLGSAQNLIGSLGGERVRWTKAVESLENQEKLLAGNILISSAIIVYLAPCTATARITLIEKWHQHVSASISCSEDFNMIKSLSSEAETEMWLQNGLPNDEFFFQNGMMHYFSKLYSVLIDPDYLADNWIRKTESRNNLTITKFTYHDYLDKLKMCIQLGKAILIHKIKETIPACLTQLIYKNMYNESDETFVIVNNEHLKIASGFKLYLVSNVDEPKFTDALCSNIVLINFSITPKGLSHCLLKIFTEIEKPELRKKRKELYQKKFKNRIELAEHENNILKTLCESETDILEDEASIKILDQSKDLAKIVREKQEDSRGIEMDIEEFRIKYIMVASFAADLYPCITKLKELNYIYQFPLDWYMNLYRRSILLSAKSKDLSKRCDNVVKSLIYQLYSNTVHSLFNNDKMIFLFLLSLYVLKFNKCVTQEEIAFFLSKDYPGNSDSNKDIMKRIDELESLSDFQTISATFNSASWQIYMESPSSDDIPTPWSSKLTIFQKLILSKVLKPYHLYRNIQKLIEEVLGEKFLQTFHYNILESYNESHNLSPILFIITPEFNPVDILYSFADKKKVLHSFNTLSFGVNENEAVKFLIDSAQTEGSWLLLQNCHLAPEWFGNLERKLTEMNFDNTHENFRLWLTSEATEAIPIELLQSSIKVIADHSTDFKQNLLRIYKNRPVCERGFFDGCPGNHRLFTRLLYGLASFHCVLQQRKKFGCIGWNTSYLFNDSDFRFSLQQLQMMVNEEAFSIKNIEKITYLIGNCHYGGYLDNYWDISLVNALLKQFMNSKVVESKNNLFSNPEEYGLPKKCDYQDYINFIYKMSDEYNPEIFSVNKIINTFAFEKNANELLEAVLDISKGHHKKTVEPNEFSLITTIEDLLRNVPDKLEDVPEDNYVISREILQVNTLINVMTESLHKLKQSIGGTKFISPEEEEMADDILNSKVPKCWCKFFYASDANLPIFIKDLHKNIDFWRNFQLTKNIFPLTRFAFPRALICKAKLDFSKKFGIALENIDFDYEISKNDSISTEEGIMITELYLLGAKWDEDCQKLTDLLSSIHNALPPILFRPIDRAQTKEKRGFRCPLYQTADSKKIITSVLLETEESNEHWAKRGVKLVCRV